MDWKKWKEKWVMFSMSIIIPIMIVIFVGFTILYPTWYGSIEFDRVYKEAVENVGNGNSSDDFKDGWIAALNHLKVLWYSGNNATSV